MKIGVDCHVARAARRKLVELGHEIVVMAQPGESDEAWFARALAAGATVIVSADYDLGRLAAPTGTRWIQITGHGDSHTGHAPSAQQVLDVLRGLEQPANGLSLRKRSGLPRRRGLARVWAEHRAARKAQAEALTWTAPGPASAEAIAAAEARRRGQR